MKPSHERVLSILYPAPAPPPAPEPHRDPATGRFVAPPGVTLSGGNGPIGPSAPRDGVAEHDAMLRDLLVPKSWA